MKRLLQWAFNGAAAVSAALFVATISLWAESYTVTDDLGWQTPVGQTGTDRWGIKTLDGFAAAHRTILDDGSYRESNGVREPKPRGFVWRSLALQIPDHSLYSIGDHNVVGFGIGGRESYRFVRMSERHIVFPLWLPAVLTAILPIKWVRAWWKRRRYHALGLCASCGYDLRATPDRCPEYGAAPKAMEAT